MFLSAVALISDLPDLLHVFKECKTHSTGEAAYQWQDTGKQRCCKAACRHGAVGWLKQLK